jgi:hypothetical protein
VVNPSFEEDVTWGTTGNINLNGTTYNPCFTQSVAAANNQFPQVLPVKGWKAESKLSPASKYALLYSMPYSFTQYCVSPSNIGNSASIMAVPAAFEDEAGSRCLSILNSWTVGTNAISQKVQLPAAAEYTLTFDMRYECANESRRPADNVITATGGNVNTALCGVESEGQTFYAPYPEAASTWQEQRITFTASDSENPTATLRFGLNTTANQGAANQTRLHVDNVRLWMPRDAYDQAVGVKALPQSAHTGAEATTYDLGGRRIAGHPRQHGIYIHDGRKIVR